MMDAEFQKTEPRRLYPYLAERTDDVLSHMVVVFISRRLALMIGRHTLELKELSEDDYTPIQGTFTLTFGGASECFQGGGPVLETRGRL